MDDDPPVLGAGGQAAIPGALSLEFKANDYLENSLKKQSQAFSLLFLGEICMSVIVWKNAQSLHYATQKKESFQVRSKTRPVAIEASETISRFRKQFM